MTAANYVVQATETDAEPTFHCVPCDRAVLATESDSHAKRVHKADQVRIFQTEAGFKIWEKEQAENVGVN